MHARACALSLQRATLLKISKSVELELHSFIMTDSSSCSSGESNYRKTRNRELSPFFHPGRIRFWFSNFETKK